MSAVLAPPAQHLEEQEIRGGKLNAAISLGHNALAGTSSQDLGNDLHPTDHLVGRFVWITRLARCHGLSLGRAPAGLADSISVLREHDHLGPEDHGCRRQGVLGRGSGVLYTVGGSGLCRSTRTYRDRLQEARR